MTTPRRPPGRYDEPKPLPRPVLYGGLALLVVALTAGSWLAYHRYSQGRVSYATLFSTVVSDTETSVRFQLRKSSDSTVRCFLNAVDRDHTEVGAASVDIGPDRSGLITMTSTVPTTARAAGGQVLSCRQVP